MVRCLYTIADRYGDFFEIVDAKTFWWRVFDDYDVNHPNERHRIGDYMRLLILAGVFTLEKPYTIGDMDYYVQIYETKGDVSNMKGR